MENHVRRLRKWAGLSQSQLADSIGVSRQTIRSIETGSVIPSTLIALRMARVLRVRVEDIFQEGEASTTITVADGEHLEIGDRVIMTEFDGRRLAHRVTAEPGQTIPIAPQAHIVEARSDEDPKEFVRFGKEELVPWTVVAGCDPALALLAAHASSGMASTPAYWMNADNARSYRLLTSGSVQVAAIHVPGTDSSLEPRLPEALSTSCHRVHFARWQLGWVIRRGNPRGFTGPHDLQGGRFRIVNRPLGAGARDILDMELLNAGIEPSCVPQYDWTVAGHMQVAMAIEANAADVGIAIAGIANTMHLDFIPIHDEWCDLWVAKTCFHQPGVQRLLDRLSSDVFRWDLARFGPYEIGRTGEMDHTSSLS